MNKNTTHNYRSRKPQTNNIYTQHTRDPYLLGKRGARTSPSKSPSPCGQVLIVEIVEREGFVQRGSQMVGHLSDLSPRQTRRLPQRIVEAVTHVTVDDVPHEHVQEEEDDEHTNNHLDGGCSKPSRIGWHCWRYGLYSCAAAGWLVVTGVGGRRCLAWPEHRDDVGRAGARVGAGASGQRGENKSENIIAFINLFWGT
eukprot:scaffold8360_cov122-Isochrysis_galbana.AAC.6